MEVDPSTILFTQDHISDHFKGPRENERIDDAANSLLEGKLKISDFPRLRVVQHEGKLWSLDNRRLWAFKNAGVPHITVDIVPYNYHPRFANLMENKPDMKLKLARKGFRPVVGGKRDQKRRTEHAYEAGKQVATTQLAPEKKRVHPAVVNRRIQPAAENQRLKPPLYKNRVESAVEQKQVKPPVQQKRVQPAVEKRVEPAIGKKRVQLLEEKRVQAAVERKQIGIGKRVQPPLEQKLFELTIEKKRVDFTVKARSSSLLLMKNSVSASSVHCKRSNANVRPTPHNTFAFPSIALVSHGPRWFGDKL